MKRVLVWGFCEEGNLGDDIMAVMAAKVVQDLGHTPIIFSSNSRFDGFSFSRIASLESLCVDHVLVSGGALLKPFRSRAQKIESRIESLAHYIESQRIPVTAVSIGSDGIDDIGELSLGRKQLICSKWLVGCATRLRKDQAMLGSKSLFIPDIVLASKYFFNVVMERVYQRKYCIPLLANISRRKMAHLAKLPFVSPGVKPSFFYAHGGVSRTGGEISVPGFDVFRSDDIFEGLEILAQSSLVASTKLHPGIIAMSFGQAFIPLSPSPKTEHFLLEYSEKLVVSYRASPLGFKVYESSIDLNRQASLWGQYSEFIRRALS